ncbi:LacI family DNA-binding transcriptional regulator [Pararhizobium sp.]|uniref:LacI family DNA-binding transcriptional regulator n=1 Tax=Pararhizobium sp. TaxID=1977563 RepID=UPI00271A9E6B|nr:LacI family DNA-binding transcriptional regulator [Pararhizobium sp.]MDO9417083.1 LacI family DNA-binding transcriptional regulator [Pararhizobium sp.]
MATIRDVAKLAGVSVSTVSLAFSDPARVHQKTRARIQVAVDATGYAADPLAQTLAKGRSKLIGLVTGNIGNAFFGDIRRELETYAIDHGHFVLAADSSGKPGREIELIEHLAGLKVAGLVLAPNGYDQTYVDVVQRLKTPVVCFDQKVAGIERDFVGSDNRLATAMLTEHLLKLGHRRIAFISGPTDLYTAQERLTGFTQTMAGAGIEPDRSLVVYGNYVKSAAYGEAMRLLTRADRPTAIIGANNVMALAALMAMQELGFRCPEDVSLAMIDDVLWSEVITPKLTMVVQDTMAMGRAVATRILHRITSPEGATEPPQEVILPPRFVLGGSCRRVD